MMGHFPPFLFKTTEKYIEGNTTYLIVNQNYVL